MKKPVRRDIASVVKIGYTGYIALNWPYDAMTPVFYSRNRK